MQPQRPFTPAAMAGQVLPPVAMGGQGVPPQAVMPAGMPAPGLAPQAAPTPAGVPPASPVPPPAASRSRDPVVQPTTPAFAWNSLVLRQFGPFQEPVRLEFPAGLGTLADSDEARRADVVASLAAVLFGPWNVPLTQGATDGPWRGNGEIEFTLESGERFRFFRDFANRRLELAQCHEEGGIEVLLDCEDADRGAEARVRQVLGVHGDALFTAATTIAGTDPDALVATLRPLAVSAGPSQAQERVIEELKTLTRSLADLGVHLQDGTEDRELETMTRLLHQQGIQVEDTTRILQNLDRIEQEGPELQRELDEWEQKVEEYQNLAAVRQRYASLASRHRSSCRICNSAADALARARALEAELDAIHEQLDADPAASLMDQTTEQNLETLARLEWDRTRLKDRIRELDMRYEAAETALSSARVAATPTEEPSPPPLPVVEAPVDDLSDLPDFVQLGTPAVPTCAALRDQRREAMQLWQRFHDDGKRLEELDGLLKEYGTLEQADTATLDRLRNSVILREKYHKQLREVGREVEQADFQKNWIGQEQARLKEACAELGVLDPDIIPAVEAKIKILEQRDKLIALDQDLRQEAVQNHRTSDIATAAGSLFGLAGGALYTTFMGGDPFLLIPGAGVVVGLAGYIFTRSRTAAAVKELRNAYDQMNKKTREVDERLKELANEPLHRLTAFLERAERLAEHQQALDDMERKLPRAKRIAILRQQKEEAEKGLADLDAQMETLKASNQGAYAALHALTGLRREHELLTSDREALLRDEWGCEADKLDWIAAASCGARWRALAQLATVVDGQEEDMPIAALVEWLDTLDDAWWRELEGQAETYDLRVARIAARAAVPPPPPPGAARSAEASASAAAREGHLEIARKLVDELGKQRDEAEAELIGGNREIIGLTRQLHVLLESVHGDVQAAKDRWRKITELRRVLVSRDATLHAVLDSWQANDVAALAQMVTSLEQESEAFESEMQRLRAEVPHFSLDAPVSPEDAESESAEMRKRRDEARKRLSQVMTEKARLESRSVINVVATEEELARLRHDKAALISRVRGLATVWRVLDTLGQQDRVSMRERFEATLNRCFQVVSGRTEKRVTIDEGGRLSLVSGIRTTPAHRLESFVRDQLVLSVRLAAEDLSTPGRHLPVFVDTMAPASDEDRKAAFRHTLERVAGERQVIILGHPEVIESWGPSVRLEAATPRS